MHVVIIPGFLGNKASHWIPWLQEELGAMTTESHVVAHSQQFIATKKWVTELEATCETIPSELPITLIAHSLGCFSAFDFACKYPERVQSLTLIGAPELFLSRRDPKKIRRVPVLGVLSENDPYAPTKHAEDFYKKAHASLVHYKKAGHMFGLQWPEGLFEHWLATLPKPAPVE